MRLIMNGRRAAGADRTKPATMTKKKKTRGQMCDHLSAKRDDDDTTGAATNKTRIGRRNGGTLQTAYEQPNHGEHNITLRERRCRARTLRGTSRQ